MWKNHLCDKITKFEDQKKMNLSQWMQKHASLLQEMDCALTILVFQNETQAAGTIFGINIAMRAKTI